MRRHTIKKEYLADFEAVRKRPFRERVDNAFIKTRKPVLDDAPFRAFDHMKDYRGWCEKHVPKWLGYGRSL